MFNRGPKRSPSAPCMSRLFVLVTLVGHALVACAPRCGPGTCAGCCDPAGTCRSGSQESACGARGLACVACGFGICAVGACLSGTNAGAGAAGGGPSGGGATIGGGASGGGSTTVDGGQCSRCRYGELCTVDGGGVSCTSDFDAQTRPYCASCGARPEACGTGANFCLIRGDELECGVDCSRGQQCPVGYECADVSVSTFLECSASSPCASNPTLPCGGGSTCPNGGACDTGFCRPACSSGSCGCLVDSDCPRETCQAGKCSLTRASCLNEQDCTAIRCSAGQCLIGRNCSPARGLTCADVRP